MKIRAALSLLGLVVTSSGFTQTSPAPATKTVPAAKKEEPPPKIEGMVLSRPNGGFLGFKFVGNTIVLTFHDAKKKKVPVDVARALVRWKMKFKPGDDRAVLQPGSDGKSLTSEKVIAPPHTLKFFLLLYRENSDQAVESYVVDYNE